MMQLPGDPMSRNQEIDLAYKALRLCACALITVRDDTSSASRQSNLSRVADLAHGLPSLAGHILYQKKHGVIMTHFHEDVVALEEALRPVDKDCIDAAEAAHQGLLEPV